MERTIVARSGRGPAILFLHGFPQTHVMWRDVAPAFTTAFSVVCADVRGYGASGKPPSTPDHGPYTKRAMARDMGQVMSAVGLARSPSWITTEADASHTGWRWTTRTLSSASRSWTSSQPPKSSTAPMRDLLW